MDFKIALNPSQYQAVVTTEGPVLVIAGAGSGKTRTLVYRVAWLIKNGVKPESILLLTFTRKASTEMLERAGLLLNYECSNVAGGTFHAFCNRILRYFGHYIDLSPSFGIMDQQDARGLIALKRKEIKPVGLDEMKVKNRTIMDVYSRSINKSTDIYTTLDTMYPHLVDLSEEIECVLNAYGQIKKESCLVDYDDLLRLVIVLFKENPEIAFRLSEQYKYIMVDEFQDTNLLQADIVKSLTSAHKNIMAVGDDSQSIYSFRGADYRNILNFAEDYPGTVLIKLEENYRSVQPILDFTNRIFNRSLHNGYLKTLYTNREGGKKPCLISNKTEGGQAAAVVEQIIKYNQSGLLLKDMAVLFRSAFHAFKLEMLLNQEGIPFVKYGGVRFTEAAHIKDILSFLRILGNVKDLSAWLRCLTMIEKIGAKTAARIYEEVAAQDNPFDALMEMSKKKKNIPGLLTFSEAVSDALTYKDPGMIVHAFRVYYEHTYIKLKYDDYPRRLRDIEQLQEIASSYEALDDFLADLALDPVEEQNNRDNMNQDALVLSTIHSAKGLEWPVVFVIWLADGYFPSRYAVEAEEDLEEERRLLYVAATRAMDSLYLHYPLTRFSSYYGIEYLQRSCLMHEIPPDLIISKKINEPEQFRW